ncbi:MAG: LpqB family beta-propeller domain-containing protein [Thermoanaerobaculia bacterium]
MSQPIGSQLGPYEILAPIGAGGMGEVYRARDTRLGREVALKTLPQALASDPERLARFEHEARSASGLNHPNIVAVYDIGTSAGTTYIGMELVSGTTLRDLLSDGALPLRRLLPIAAQIASGLATAHEAGIVHRDLKPENVMVTKDGRVKILDFGLAKLVPAAESGESRAPTASPPTEPGTVMGTVGYMSPEQVRGLSLDARSDIFSFGAVLYEMGSGHRPFRGATGADVMTAILKEEPPDLQAGTSQALGRIAFRCLEKAPERRFQSARDLGFALESLVSPTESGPSPASAAPAPSPRRPSAWWPGLLLLAAGLVVGWFLRPALLRSHAPTLARAVRVTSGPALKLSPAISPDGKWVAFLSNARGPMDVWVQFLAGSEAVDLTEKAGLEVSGRADVGGLDISPDGSLVAFDAGRSPGTPSSEFDSWVLPAPLGGTPRRLVERGRGLRWSPDGKRIVYVKAGAALGDSLLVADADGGNAREILKREGGRHTHWAAWSPDGAYVYFNYGLTGANREPTSIFRVPAAGGPPEPVVLSSRRAVFPAPMPDGVGLLYAANPDTADLSLWWRPTGKGAPVRLTRGVGEYAEPRVSRDGRTVVATLIEPREGLVRLPVSFDATPSFSPVTSGYLGDFDPTMSLQGDRLVWSSSRSGNRNLWVGAPDGSGARPLTTGTAFDEHPAISPDGKRVAFVSDRGGERAIWEVSSDGGAPRRVAAAQVLDTLTWSPDATEIVFAAPAGDLPGLYRVALADGKVRRLPTPAGAQAPAWRPDSFEIAYLSLQPPNLWGVVRYVDGEGKPLHADWPAGPPLANGLLAWAADGRRLMALSLTGGQSGSIYVSESDGALRKLATLESSTRIRGATWSADGQSLVLGKYEPSSDVVLFNVE